MPADARAGRAVQLSPALLASLVLVAGPVALPAGAVPATTVARGTPSAVARAWPASAAGVPLRLPEVAVVRPPSTMAAVMGEA